MVRNDNQPFNDMDQALVILRRLDPTLSNVRHGLENYPSATINRYADSLGDIGRALRSGCEQLEQAANSLRANEQIRQEAADDLRYDLRVAERNVQQHQQTVLQLQTQLREQQAEVARLQQLSENYRAAHSTAEQQATLCRQVANDRQRTINGQNTLINEHKQTIDEQKQTIEELKADLRAERRRNDRLSVPPSPRPRRSEDSGFSDTSNSSSPGQQQLQRLAQDAFADGVHAFESAQYRRANDYFENAENFLKNLPANLTSTIDPTQLAYYRAVCKAHTGTFQDGRQALASFIVRHSNAAPSLLASARHHFARVCVRLNELGEATNQCIEAVGLRYNINPDDDLYFDSVALLHRIYTLTRNDVIASSILRNSNANRRDMIRTRYADLRPGGVHPSHQPDGQTQQQPPAPTVSQPTTNTTATRRTPTPTPTKAPPRPAASTVSTSSATSTTLTERSRRQRQREAAAKLPWLFRVALM